MSLVSGQWYNYERIKVAPKLWIFVAVKPSSISPLGAPGSWQELRKRLGLISVLRSKAIISSFRGKHLGLAAFYPLFDRRDDGTHEPGEEGA
ncbi:hypothetical protein M378DRAFT_160014 [Amanita muscaria Koide BX008]|uniref:Uncharacterized protein n=1 Tax=Amanita muscaria (strain Koide BX008) TaxID=946122 RepID=A0A0C2SUH9_AMAMK|nr:hypothetical protein M378DRAFT_160014 [Amanita muscaria Koide BX008]